ncbi:MAG: M20 family metallopeptidase [Candidatus Promineifilaceae bacterium]|nr:M20 family metallopeptidase [Candidatus Promineifilaceae bacterium]
MNRAQSITAYLEEQRESMIRFLSRLVLAESPSTHPESQAVPLTQLWEALDDLGYAVQLLPGQKSGGHLLAHSADSELINEKSSRQLLIGHCDTVWPIGTLKDMPLEIKDGVIRGPGVYDMKGGLTQIIFALRALEALQFEPPVAPVIFINSDEEIGSEESRPHICRLAQDAKRAFILEPALGITGKLKTARKGVGHFEVEIHGRAAHAGLDPEKGISAILALTYVIQELYELSDLENGISVNVGTIDGGMRTNVIAPLSRATVDVRAPTIKAAEQLQEAVYNLQSPLPGTTLNIKGGFNRPPLEPTPANRELWQAAHEAARELGLSLEQGMAGGGSDGNYTSLYTATLDGLGAVGDGAHARHEFLFIEKLIERTALLVLLLMSP